MAVEIGRAILRSALERATAGSEGARLVGSQLSGVTGSTVQEMIEGLKSLVDSKAASVHAARHKTGAADAIAPADIGAAATGHGHADATSSASGFFSPSEKARLAAIGQNLHIERTTDVLLAHGWNVIPWNGEVSDPHGWWDSANPNQIVIPEPGTYWFTPLTVWNSNTTGIRSLRVRRASDSVTVAEGQLQAAADDQYGRVTFTQPVIVTAANQAFEIDAFQSSGADLNFGKGTVTSLPTPYLKIVRHV
jgi:hypothetical protein